VQIAVAVDGLEEVRDLHAVDVVARAHDALDRVAGLLALVDAKLVVLEVIREHMLVAENLGHRALRELHVVRVELGDCARLVRQDGAEDVRARHHRKVAEGSRLRAHPHDRPDQQREVVEQVRVVNDERVLLLHAVGRGGAHEREVGADHRTPAHDVPAGARLDQLPQAP